MRKRWRTKGETNITTRNVLIQGHLSAIIQNDSACWRSPMAGGHLPTLHYLQADVIPRNSVIAIPFHLVTSLQTPTSHKCPWPLVFIWTNGVHALCMRLVKKRPTPSNDPCECGGLIKSEISFSFSSDDSILLVMTRSSAKV